MTRVAKIALYSSRQLASAMQHTPTKRSLPFAAATSTTTNGLPAAEIPNRPPMNVAPTRRRWNNISMGSMRRPPTAALLNLRRAEMEQRKGVTYTGEWQPFTAIINIQKRMYGVGSHVSNNDPEVLEREKERVLKGQVTSVIPEATGWNEKLASDSEAIVKADRSKKDSIPDLVEETFEYMTDAGLVPEGAVPELESEVQRAEKAPPSQYE
ncbi:hypothetical protein HK102_004509 [Quaeritorhiza haematococci]|nr:hypothetical protein HK102_004509 [Quaeritorhiza haematococci]